MTRHTNAGYREAKPARNKKIHKAQAEWISQAAIDHSI